jgi:NodT family efflux transporter outer membrane factor (OMF) lipoprotein
MAVLIGSLFSILTSGCAVGPDFRSPPSPSTSLSPTPLANAVGRRGERLTYVEGLAIPQRWWELFHCSALNSILTRAISANPDLQAAQAALRIADANMQAARGSFFPQVDANVGASSQRPNPAQSQPPGNVTSPYSVASGQLSVSFALDVFGGNRRRVESLTAQAEAQYFEVEAAYLTLTSKIALAAIAEASLRDEIRSAETSVSVGRDVLGILKQQADAHEATLVDVSTQDVALSQFEQNLQSLKKRLAVGRNLMAALAGGLAGDGIQEKFEFACLQLPKELPLSLPADVVRRRPDVRAAEANMHSATAEVGVAMANRFPQFNLTASAGASAVAKFAGAWPPFLFWSIAGSAAQTLFDGMSLAQKQRAAEAGLDRSEALYRSTVIAAFQNVADVLQTMEADRRSFVVARRGMEAAKGNLDRTRMLLAKRLASAVQVLNAQQLYAQASSSHAQAKAALRANSVMLFQALGGGWKGDQPQKGNAWITTVSNADHRAVGAPDSPKALMRSAAEDEAAVR